MILLNTLCTSYDELRVGSDDPESLNETKRKNQSEGLTNITDNSFNFFIDLELLCRTKLTHANLVDYGKDLFVFVETNLLTDSGLFEKFILKSTPKY